MMELIFIGNTKKLGNLCQKGVKVVEDEAEKRSDSDMVERPETEFSDTSRKNGQKALQPFSIASAKIRT